jgi:Zn-dependent protease
MNFLTFFVVLVGWVFSLCLHEFSHALVAYYGGDYTVKEKAISHSIRSNISIPFIHC